MYWVLRVTFNFLTTNREYVYYSYHEARAALKDANRSNVVEYAQLTLGD